MILIGAVGDRPSFLSWIIERRSIKSREKLRKADVIIWFSLLWYCYFKCYNFSKYIFLSKVLVFQLCPTLCNPMDCSWPGSSATEFSRQEYWSGLLPCPLLPFPSPGDLPHPGVKPRSPALQADSLPSELPRKPKVIG